jgi:YHS domain-containing protein
MIAKTLTGLAAALTLPLFASSLPAPDGPTGGRREAQAALKPFASLVGEWRGTGLPQRGSNKGAWTETGVWAWKLSPDTAALELTISKGKLLRSGLLRAAKEPGHFAFDAMLADGTKRTFAGKHEEKKPLVLVAEPSEGEGLRRVTINPLHDTRLLLLLEARNDDGAGFHRIAEVGYTRQGVAFAAGESYPLCIVTEGRGTTQVSYQGKTYYVCCSGCKDLFNDNPAAILAEAAERKKAKDAQK